MRNRCLLATQIDETNLNSKKQYILVGNNAPVTNFATRNQSEGLTERINEPPLGRCLQGAVDVRWVVVVVVVSSSPRTASSRALGSTVTLLRSNGDASMGLDDGAMR